MGTRVLPKVSLLVLSYNGKNITPIILDSILKINYPADKIETIIIDNASTDGSVEVFKLKYPWAKILSMPKNVAYAAFNSAVKECTGEYCFVLNNDCEIHPQCILELVTVFEKHPYAVAAAPAMYDYTTRKLMYTRKFLSRSFYNGSDYKTNFSREDDLRAGYETYTGVPMLKTSFARTLPYVFDPDYFLYVEDVDLAYRLRLMGYTIYRSSSAILYHKPGTTAKEVFSSPRLTFLIERNTFQTFFKNLAWHNLLFFFPYFLGLRLFNLLRYVVQGNFGCSKAMVGAWWWNVVHSSTLISKRCGVQRLRKVRDAVIFSQMMDEGAVIRYMVGKRKYH